MSERFDDMIRKQLEGLESPVPKDMFDAIRNQPDVSDATFDAGLKHKLQLVESPVSSGLFDKINKVADLVNAPFDDAVKHRLTGYESPVPADMWSRMMQEKHRRRPVAWWWVAAGIVLLLSGSTWYAVRQPAKKQEISENSNSSAKKEDKTLTDPILSREQTAPPKKQHTITGTLPVKQPKNTLDKHDLNQASGDDNASQAKAYQESTKPKNQLREPFSAIADHLRHQKQTGSLTENAYGKIQITGSSNEMGLQPTGDDALMEMDDFATVSALRSAINGQLRMATTLLPDQLQKAKPRLPVIPCPVNRADSRNDWYADVYTSVFLVQKSIWDKAAGKDTKGGFDSTLHRQLSYNAGISVVKNIGNNLLFKTGVQYNRSNESFRLTRINERKLVTTISFRTVIIAPGDTVYIRDTAVTEHIGTIQRRSQNTYQQWDIPVVIGYEFGGENIRLNANAGIIANIRSAYAGQMLDDSLQHIIDANNYNGKPVYKTNIGFSLYAGLSILKPLGERTSLMVEPFARIGLQNSTTNHAWFRQKNSAAGITIGLRYKINSDGQRRLN